MATRRKGKVVSLSGDPVKHYGEAPQSFAPPPAELGTDTIVEPVRPSVGR